MTTVVKDKEPGESPVYYRFAPDFRRIGVYLLVSALMIAATMAIYQYLGVTPRSRSEICFFILFFPGSMCGLALVLLRQLLRVDDRGIWRRRMFRWDLWPWEAFAGEQIQPGYIYPVKPWWNRHLLLEFLAEKDRKQLDGIIKRVWKPAPLPPLPKELTIRWGLRYWAILSEEGIHIGKGKQDAGCFYRWWTGIEVRLSRFDHSRRDLHEVELALPGIRRPIQLRRHQGRPLWRGATPEVLAAFLEHVVPPTQLLIAAQTGIPRTQAEAEWRLKTLQRFDRETRQFRWIFAPLVLVLLACFGSFFVFRVWNPNQPPWDFARWFFVGVFGFQVGVFALLIIYVELGRRKEANAKRAELAAWRESLSS